MTNLCRGFAVATPPWRSLVETAMSRYKPILRRRLPGRTLPNPCQAIRNLAQLVPDTRRLIDNSPCLK